MPQPFFPPGALSANDWHDRFKANWYAKALTAMKEPSLSAGQTRETESYRFLWLRTFHNPIVVRVWRSGTTVQLIAKQLDGAGGYDPGKLVVNNTRALTSKEWDEFAKHLEQSSYWTLKTDGGDIGTDGAQWILEGTKDGRYHVVDRWTPKEADRFRKTCFYLLELSGLKPKNSIY